MQCRIIWPIEFTKLKIFTKITQLQKEIIVISIKASYRDLAKNLELMLMKVFFFLSPSIKKFRYFVLTLIFFNRKYYAEEKLKSEEKKVNQ